MATDWTEIRKNAYSTEKGPPEWPSGARPISMGGVGLFGIGPDNRLF
jgi:hypothetical protein